MPMFKALKACPDAVVIRPEMAKYAQAGRPIRERLLALTPLVAPLSIDEAFLDPSGTQALHPGWPERRLSRPALAIEPHMGSTPETPPTLHTSSTKTHHHHPNPH